MIQGLINGIFNGVSIGSVLLMSALGLAIVFGLMGVINLAHGELMMLGAYTTYVVQNVAEGWGEPWTDLYIFPALVLAFLVAAATGFVLERGVIRFLYGNPLETLLATWGVSLILRQFVRSANWALAIALTLFAIIFVGGQWAVNRWNIKEKLEAFGKSKLLPLYRSLEQRGRKTIPLFLRRIWRIPQHLVARLGQALWDRPGLIIGAIAISLSLLTGKLLLGEDDQAPLQKLWFGTRNVDVTPPAWLRGGLSLGNLTFPYARLFIIALMLVCLGGVYWFLQRSRWGLRIRAVTQNRQMSACLGIPTETVDALAFALGSGLAGIAGCTVTFLGSVGPNLGGNYIVDAFMVVVVGGVGKLVGTVVAAMLIGITSYLIGSGILGFVLGSLQMEALQPLVDTVNFFATSSMAKVMVFALIIVFLQIRPAGLFPQKGRSVDA